MLCYSFSARAIVYWQYACMGCMWAGFDSRWPDIMFQTNLKKKLIWLVIVAIAALIFWNSIMFQEEYWRLVDFFENQVTVKPVLSIFIFLFLTVFSMMFLFFSSILLVPVAVSVWGSLTTTVLLLAGWLLGAIFSYILGRYVGYPILKYFISSRKLDYYHNLFSENSSFLLVFLLRFTLPSEIPGYILGLLRFNFQKYLLITMLAEIPYAFVMVYAIGAILNQDPVVLGFIAFIWLAAVALLARLLYKKFPMNTL